MKITGSGPVRSTSETSRSKIKGESGKSRFAEALETGSKEVSAAVSGAGGVAAVDALLAIQEVSGSTSGRSVGVRRAEQMLSHLDEIRLGLLEGAIPRDHLSSLLEKVRERREDTQDPRLNSIMDEIELRAAVELAKLDEFT